MKSFLDLMANQQVTAVGYNVIFQMICHSVALGMILVISTHFMSRVLRKYAPSPVGPLKKEIDPVNQILGASNLLFLCVGLTGVMLLVNNSLIRAFAVLSAIALVRFRVKLDNSNGFNSSLLFAILAGMACGVQEIAIAWIMTAVYLILLFLLVISVRLARLQNPAVTKSYSTTPTTGEN